MKLLILLSFLILVSPVISLSQKKENKELTQPNKMISFVPFYLVTNGIRIDFDRKIKENHWLQIAPQFYLREHGDNDPGDYYNNRRFTNLVGAGLHLYHRVYMNKEFSRLNPYMSYGATWQYFNLKYNETPFSNEIERYSEINKVGGDAIVGFVFVLNNFLALDFYGGVGYRYSFLHSDATDPIKFNNFYTDYGYKGNLITTGVRISFLRN